MAETGKRSPRRVVARAKRAVGAHAKQLRLRESSEQFQLAQDALGIVTWIWNTGADRVQWYGDMSRLLGLAPGEFRGRFPDYLARVHPEDAEAAKTVFVECLKGLRSDYRTAERVIWPDGSHHWLETYGRAEYGADGRALRMAGVIKDITERKRLELQATETGRKFSTLFETSPVGLIVTRPRQRRVIEANEAALHLIGLKREQVIGAHVEKLARALDRDAVDRMRARALAGERVSRILQFERLDGKVLEIILSGAVIDLDGEPHFILSLLDITEQRRMERERTEADARYRILFDAAMDGMVVTKQGIVVDANPAASAMTGYSQAELIGLHVSRFYSAEELAARPLRTTLEARWSVLERVLARKGGGNLPIEVLAGPLPDGKVLAIMRDITERKRNETLLMNVARGVSAELGEAFFRSLVEHLARELGADFAFIGEVVPPANDRVRTLACVMDGAIGENFEYRLEGSPCINAITKRGTVIYPQGVAELFPRDGGLKKRGIQAYVGTSLHAADGSALGVLVVMHRKPVERGAFWASMIEIFGARAAAEIERSRAEALVRQTNASLEQVVRERTAQLEEANRDLESYNYSISHDLRQPLNAIAGFSELLRDNPAGTLDGAADEYLREIETNSLRMEQMIDALLRLSQAGRGALSESQVDAKALVEAVLRDLSTSAPLAAEVVVGELPPAKGDPALLRQVWANLLGNAIKYSGGGTAPRIEITGSRREGMVEYVVRDNGVGFDMRHAGRLFEAFQRLPTAGGFEGRGIGLAIVQRIVRRHGGTISAESTPGKGATFRFTLLG